MLSVMKLLGRKSHNLPLDEIYLRKKTYSIWVCNRCSNTCYYMTLRCAMCNSKNIDEVGHETPYGLAASAHPIETGE